MYRPICLVSSLCLTAFPIKAADNVVSMKDFDKLLKYDEVKISADIENDYLASYMELNYPSSYAALPSNGSCKACLSGCASGAESVGSSQCYTSTGSYLSCSTAKNVTCYKGLTTAYSDCAAAGFLSSKSGMCGTTTKNIKTNPGGECGSATCYTGGSTCKDSCTTGSATIASGKCYTGTTSYTNCSSCSSTTCYTGQTTAYADCAAAGYSSSKTGKCGTTTKAIKTNPGGECGSATCYTGGSTCQDSCPSGSSASVGNSQCYTNTASYTNCSSCSDKTCYKGLQTVNASCSAAGYRASAGNYCNYSTPKIYTGTAGGACGSQTTCYSGGTECTSSCPSGSVASVSNSQCYGGTTSYTSCTSCASTTCYKSVQTVNASCSAAGYRASAGNYCNYSTPKIYTGTAGGACGSQTTCYSGGTECTSSCPSGSVASVSNTQCYGSTTSYTSCDSCSSTTCYVGIETAQASCSAAGYLDANTGCGASSVQIFTGAGGRCSPKTCYTAGYTVCDSSSYPYQSNAVSNGKGSGTSCYGRRGTSGGSCTSSTTTTYYSSFTCNSGFCKKSDACYKTCPESSYPYTSVSGATMTGSCTGIRGNSGGNCTGSSTGTYYSGFTCKGDQGWYLSDDGKSCEYDPCSCSREYDNCCPPNAGSCFSCSERYESCRANCYLLTSSDTFNFSKSPMLKVALSENECREKYLSSIDNEEDFTVYNTMA